MENVQILQIRNAQNQLACHTRTKPQWSSKVIINCEKQLSKDIEYEHSGDMEKKTNKVDEDGQGPGIVEESESRNIGDDQKIPETVIFQEQCL